MSAPLSNELFHQVHRGMLVNTAMGKKVDTQNLGMHWSRSEDKAEEFAIKQMHWPDRTGYVYHGQVPMSSVETNTERLKKRGYAGFSGKDPLGEKEIPVKEGAAVKVTGRTKYKRKMFPGGSEVKMRTRTYNPPREMKA